MIKNSTMKNSMSEIRVCKGNTCIKAKGDNAKVIVFAFAFMLVCIGIAAIASK